MIIADNSLLSLSSLCLLDGADPMIPGGTHLRWNLYPGLGFPHGGFRLRSRPASQWPWVKTDFLSAFFGRHSVISESGIESRFSPISAEDASLTTENQLHCVNRKPMKFIYNARAEIPGPLSQPFVRFAVGLKEKNGGVPRSKVELRGFARRNGHDVEVASMVDVFNRLPDDLPDRFNGIKFIHLSHNEIDFITLTAADNIIVEVVYYTTANFFHKLDDWQTLDIFGPLCEPNTTDVLSPPDPVQLALARLKKSRPIRRATEPKTGSIGRRLTSQDHLDFETKIASKVTDWSKLMTEAFRLEMKGRTPPADISISDLDNEHIDPNIDSNKRGHNNFPFYGLIQASSFEPHIAHMLGLAFFHEDGADSVARDYAIDAIVPELWFKKIGATKFTLASFTPTNFTSTNFTSTNIPSNNFTLTNLSNRNLNVQPNLESQPHNSNIWEDLPANFVQLASFSIDQKAENPTTVRSPTLSAKQIDRPSGLPIQAGVKLKVSNTPIGTRYLVWRNLGRSLKNVDKDISPVDPISNLLTASVPDKEGDANIYDRELSDYKKYNYGAVSVDVFGRVSKVKNASIKIEDNIAPPEPNTPEVILGDQHSVTSNLFNDSSISFTWSENVNLSAPDVIEFELIWKAGYYKEESDIKKLLRNPDGKLTIPWPSSAPGTDIQQLPNNGFLLTSTIDLLAQKLKQRWEVTVVCRVKDRANNLSSLSAPGYGVFTESIIIPSPPQPDEPQWSSWPDARRNVRWRCRWALPQNAVSSRLLIASELRILQLSKTDHSQHITLTPAKRAAALKKLAKITPNAFIPSELALPIPTDYADVVMKSGSLDWSVAIVELISKTGQKSDWPTRIESFAVIRPRTIDPIQPPVLNVDIIDDSASVVIQSAVEGEIKVFTTKHPEKVEASIALGPSASLIITPTTTEQVDIDLSNHEGWIGFFARLQSEDGRRSELSKILWRKK